MQNSIQIIRGDDASFEAIFKDQEGTPIDLTGYTVYFTVKLEKDLNLNDDAVAVIKKGITAHSAPLLGTTTVELTHEETNQVIGVYVWDLQLKSPTGKISSTNKGFLEIIQDVSSSIS